MRVRVLYFGVLKDRFGRADERMEVAVGESVAGLLRILRARTSNAAMGRELTGKADAGLEERLWRSLAVAVNREYASLETVLREDDEVALLPPVSGGSYAAVRFWLRLQGKWEIEASALLAKEMNAAVLVSERHEG